MKSAKSRRLLCILLAVVTLITVTVTPIGAYTGQYLVYDGVVYPEVELSMNGKRILAKKAILVDGVTMVPLRAICETFGADYGNVTWNADTRTGGYVSNVIYLSAQYGANYIVANDRYIYNDQPVQIIDGTMFVPIRSIAKAFGATIEWNGKRRSANLVTGRYTILNGAYFYDDEDLYWLSRIINAESKFEPLLGKIAVGNVVMNRVASPLFPDTVQGVVFDRRGGVTQFQPADHPIIYETPTRDAVIAAKIVLDGYQVSDSILYFQNIDLSNNFWIVEHCQFEVKIGHHSFFS